MNDRKKRTRSLCLALLLALSSCLLVPPYAKAAEDGRLKVEISNVPKIYNGSRYEPKVRTVTLDGQPLEMGAYQVFYGANTRPGIGTVTVTVVGIDGYTGSVTEMFTILPRPLSGDNLEMRNPCVKPYDGTDKASPEIKVNALPGDDVAVSYAPEKTAYEDPYVGATKTVTARGLTLTGDDKDCYVLEEKTFTKDVGQITPQIITAPSRIEVAVGQQLDLKDVISGLTVPVTFHFTGASNGSQLLEEGTKFQAGSTTGSVRLSANVPDIDLNNDGTAEYQGNPNFLVEINIVDQVEQTAFKITGPTSISYGQTAQFRAAGGDGNGEVTYYVEGFGPTGEATINSKSGLLTSVQAGQVRVYAVKEGTGGYKPASSNVMVLTIRPAQLTIRVRDKSAQVLDPVPELTKSDYTVSGLVGGDKLQVEPTLFYAAAPNMLWEGEVPIRADYAVAPDLINYNPKINYVDGTLTIRKQPQYDVTVRTPQNGTLTVTPTSAREGETVTVIARPDRGYELRALTATSGRKNITLHEKTANLYTFTMPDGDVRLSASFLRDLPFVDVPEKAWYYEDVAYVYGNDLMDGTTPLTFSPDVTTSRGMIVTMLYRMDGRPTPPGWQPFADVDQDSYYADAVAWAAWNGVVNGMAPDRFAPWDKITRQQLAAILYRYAQYKNCHLVQGSDLSKFQDGHKVSDYAKVPMAWANKEGLIQGKGSNTLDPNGLATRAEAAATLHRFCEDVLP